MTAASLLYSYNYVSTAPTDVKHTVRAGNTSVGLVLNENVEPLFQNTLRTVFAFLLQFHSGHIMMFIICYLLLCSPILWDSRMVNAHLTGALGSMHDSPFRDPYLSPPCHLPRIPSGGGE